MSRQTFYRCDECGSQFAYAPEDDETWVFKGRPPMIGERMLEVHVHVYVAKPDQDICGDCALNRARVILAERRRPT